jgi:hypothetical protein
MVSGRRDQFITPRTNGLKIGILRGINNYLKSFDMGNLDLKRKKELELKRLEFNFKTLLKYGYVATASDDGTYLTFEFQGKPVKFYAYSGWHSGKSIVDGRGLGNLIEQIKEKPGK